MYNSVKKGFSVLSQCLGFLTNPWRVLDSRGLWWRGCSCIRYTRFRSGGRDFLGVLGTPLFNQRLVDLAGVDALQRADLPGNVDALVDLGQNWIVEDFLLAYRPRLEVAPKLNKKRDIKTTA